MRPSSRTPEGKPNRCPVCGNEIRIDPSSPADDAPCPHCGHLLWFPTLAVRRVLIADDDNARVECLKASLGDMDLETIVATDAEEILASVKRCRPAVLLLNPALRDGFEVCRQVKNNPETSKTMVLMISEMTDLGDIERAVEAGTDDFVGEPVVESELRKRISHLLALHQGIDEVGGL